MRPASSPTPLGVILAGLPEDEPTVTCSCGRVHVKRFLTPLPKKWDFELNERGEREWAVLFNCPDCGSTRVLDIEIEAADDGFAPSEIYF